MSLDPLPTDHPASQRSVQEAMRDRINSLLAQSGSASDITEIANFGTDIALLNDWDVVPAADRDSPARIYKQGGRAWLAGYFLVGSDRDICVIPDDYAPSLLGSDLTDYYLDWPRVDNRLTLEPNNNGAGPGWLLRPLTLDGLTPGDYWSMDGVSWPLAAAEPG